MKWKSKQAEVFWDRSAKNYDRQIDPHDSVAAAILNRSRKYLHPDSVVLDLGCATGNYALEIAGDVQKVYGIDISEEMIQAANKNMTARNISNVSFLKADVSDRQLNTTTYNSILAFNLLHLVENPGKTIATISNLLPPRGIFLSATPCLGTGGSLQKLLIKSASLLGMVPGVHAFKPNDVEALISHAHFELLETHIIPAKIPVIFIAAKKRP